MPKYNPEIHHRRSIRLKDYDYCQTGAYFVTISSWNRECIFGDIIDGNMRLNEYGEIVEREWLQAGAVRSSVELDAFIVMPNHIHGILIITDYVGARRCLAQENENNNNKRATHRVAPTGVTSGSIGAIIGQFKSAVTKQINRIRNNPDIPIWHRNYYEHVIRNEEELHRIREYIINNPLNWTEDENNPVNMKMNSSCRGEALPRP